MRVCRRVGGCAGGNKFGRNARVAAKWGKVTPTDFVCSPLRCDGGFFAAAVEKNAINGGNYLTVGVGV